MGETLDYRGWPKLEIEFLRDHIEAAPLSRDRVQACLRLAKVLGRYARWKEAEPHKGDFLISWALNDHAQLLQDTNRLAEAEPLMRRASATDEASSPKLVPALDRVTVAPARSVNNGPLRTHDENRLESDP
jgi:hypothetical protein